MADPAQIEKALANARQKGDKDAVAVLEAMRAPKPVTEVSADALTHHAKLLGTGFAEGLGGSIESGLNAVFGESMDMGSGKHVPSFTETASSLIHGVTGWDPQSTAHDEPPTNATELWEKRAASGSGGAAITGGGTVKQVLSGLAQGAVGGVVGGAAADLVTDPGTKSLMGELAGASAQTVLSLLSRVPGWTTRNGDKLLREALQHTTPQEWAVAHAQQAHAQKSGFNLIAGEPLPAHSPVQDLAGAVAASPRSQGKLQQAAQERVPQVKAAARRAVRDAGGANIGMQPAANQMQEAATTFLKDREDLVGQIVGPVYETANTGKVPFAELDSVFKGLQDASATAPEERRVLIDKFMRNLANAGDNVGALRDVYMTTRDKIKSGLVQGGDTNTKRTEAMLMPHLKQLQAVIEKHSPATKQANILFGQLNDILVNPVKQGPVGSITGESGYKSDVPAPVKNIVDELRGEEAAASPERIRELGRYLQRVNPKAVPDVVQSYLALRLAQAAERTRKGENPQVGANMKQAIYGSDRQRALTDAMLEVAAKSSGRSPRRVVEGFKRTMAVLESTAKTPGIGSPTHSRGQITHDIETPPWRLNLADVVRKALNSGSYGRLADIMISPRSLEIMEDIATTPVSSPKYNKLVASLLGANAGAQQGARDGQTPQSSD
jgi:hypothetical protein